MAPVLSTEFQQERIVQIDKQMPAKFSIVICTHNRERLLAQAIESILSLRKEGLPCSYELVVVDNNSSDNTRSVVDKYREKADFPVRYIFEARQGLAHARNAGIRNSSGEYLLFIDDDCTLRTDWLFNLMDSFRTYDCDIIQGKILLDTQNVQIPNWMDKEELSVFGYYDIGDETMEVSDIYGGNVSFRRAIFEKYGLFDVRLGEGASGRGEDTEFFRRIKPSGIKALYIPEVVSYHQVHKDRLNKAFILDRYYKSGYSFALFRDNSDYVFWQVLTIGRKLLFRYLKSFLYGLIRNETKKYRQEKRIHFYRGNLRGRINRKRDGNKKRNMTLSVCIITMNNQDMLGAALESVESVADEIVVVDGGSADDTKELACSFGKVKYHYHQWPDNYAVQKNFAMDRASGDWILILDSDETIGSNMRKKIHRLIRSPKHDCYIFPTYWIIQKDPLRYVESKKLYPDYHQRLFRNLPQYRYVEERKIHEKFPEGVQEVGNKIKDTHIFHFDFIYNDRKAREEKARKRTALAPETAHVSRNAYLFEDAPYPWKIKKCRERLW